MYELSLQDSQLQFEKKLVKVCEDCTTLMKQQVSVVFLLQKKKQYLQDFFKILFRPICSFKQK